jgi:diguanylate cyclase (GGDEF)-like protein
MGYLAFAETWQPQQMRFVALVAGGYLLAERFAVRTTIGETQLNYTVSEVPLLVGAIFVHPLLHVAIRFCATFLGSFSRISRRRNYREARSFSFANAMSGSLEASTFLSIPIALGWNGSLNSFSALSLLAGWIGLSISFHPVHYLVDRIRAQVTPVTNIRRFIASTYLSLFTMSAAAIVIMACRNQTRYALGLVILLVGVSVVPFRYVVGLLVEGERYRSLDSFYAKLQSIDSERAELVLKDIADVTKCRYVELVVLEREGVDRTLNTAIVITRNGRATQQLQELSPPRQAALQQSDGSRYHEIDKTKTAEIICPLIVSGKAVGLLVCAEPMDGSAAIGRNEKRTAIRIAQHLSPWIEQTRLVGELRREMAQRTQQALHDPLTGALNRRGLTEQWELLVGEEPAQLGLFLIDLDRFKDVNSYSGHTGGDQVLREVAERLFETVPSGATVARLGGDEFAVLLPTQTHTHELHEPLPFALELRNALSEPHIINGESMHVGGTVGFAFWPEHGQTLGELLGNADTALFIAKDDSANGVCGFSTSHFKADSHTIDSYRLRSAIDHGDIVVAYQPMIDMRTYRVAGFEALARWRDGQDMIMPTQFIALAERSGHIHDLTEFIVRQSFVDIMRWRASTGLPLHVGVNFSPVCIANPLSLDVLTNALHKTDLDPSAVFIEVTESRMFRDPIRATDHLDAMKKLGVKISLDDFGTGASTYEWLMRLAPDQLKVDRIFVRDVDDARATGIMEVDALLAERFGMSLVAEGIETVNQWHRARALGMTYGQGYLTGRPMLRDEVDRWLLNDEPRIKTLIRAATAAVVH